MGVLFSEVLSEYESKRRCIGIGEGVEVNDEPEVRLPVQEAKEKFIEQIVNGPKPGRIKEKWRIHPDDVGKFFVYQPTGGWGNQRMILKSAIAAANAMGRVLVLPMISPRKNLEMLT